MSLIFAAIMVFLLAVITVQDWCDTLINKIDLAGPSVKNTYRTMLTRGMKGCYIYCTDPGMQAYLKRRVEMTTK